jgi:hypothetical protein
MADHPTTPLAWKNHSAPRSSGLRVNAAHLLEHVSLKGTRPTKTAAECYRLGGQDRRTNREPEFATLPR